MHVSTELRSGGHRNITVEVKNLSIHSILGRSVAHKLSTWKHVDRSGLQIWDHQRASAAVLSSEGKTLPRKEPKELDIHAITIHTRGLSSHQNSAPQVECPRRSIDRMQKIQKLGLPRIIQRSNQ